MLVTKVRYFLCCVNCQKVNTSEFGIIRTVLSVQLYLNGLKVCLSSKKAYLFLVFLCRSSCAGTHSIDQSVFKLRIHLPLPALKACATTFS